MNKDLTKANVKAAGFSLAGWARRNNLPYQSVGYLFRDNRPKLETGVQRRIIKQLKADGFYVPSESDVEEDAA